MKKFEKVSMIIELVLTYYPYDDINWDKVEEQYGKEETDRLKNDNKASIYPC